MVAKVYHQLALAMCTHLSDSKSANIAPIVFLRLIDCLSNNKFFARCQLYGCGSVTDTKGNSVHCK